MNGHSFLSERETYIISLLEINPRISTHELCDILHMAPSTVRKQLAEMEAKGMLLRVHGGAVSIDSRKDEPINQKSRQNVLPKRAIASQARSLIHDGDVLALGSGTTVGEMCNYLMDLNHSVIYTNSMIVANMLSKNERVEVRICNGIVRGRTSCIVGPGSSTYFKNIRVDKTFIGPDAVNIVNGVVSSNISVAQVEKQMLLCASEKYILCDSSKLGKSSLSQIIPLENIDFLITDFAVNKLILNEIMQKGVHVSLAKWNHEI